MTNILFYLAPPIILFLPLPQEQILVIMLTYAMNAGIGNIHTIPAETATAPGVRA